MSETSIPFQGQTSVLDRPAPELDPEPPAGSNRTLLLALGGLAAALVVGLVAYFLVFAGSGDDAADAAPSAPQAAAPAPAEEAAEGKVKQPKLTEKNYGRDPFEARIVEPAAASGAATGTGTEAAPVDNTAGGTAGGTSSNGAGTGSEPASPSGPEASTAHSFKVVDVAPDNSTVTVKVDGDTYRNLSAGEVFADMFKVRFIGGQVNSFQIGDEVFNVSGKKKVTISG
jgi:hypothetical protein